VAEGGGLLNRYRVKSSIGGSNPPLSAIHYGCVQRLIDTFNLKSGLPLLALAFACLTASAQAPQPSITAEDAMARILEATGATVPANTVDTLKAGDPKTVVTGVATTFMDTYSVLQQAVADGKNLIVTHEPTFYNHQDDRSTLGDDAVQAQKLAYINEHHLVVWRFHDTWHLRKPDGILEGVMEEFGLKQYQGSADPHLFVVPATTVAQLADSLQTKAGSRSIRIVGDTAMSVTHVALLPGASGLTKQAKYLERDDVQVLVAGESAEWEGVEYAQDAAAEGRHKALILLGHEVSEEAGMRNCASWIKTVLPGVPVEFIQTGEPFQTPQSLQARKR
jgi:putative NIF3 family GTP cyclohydrolase 1 type 2